MKLRTALTTTILATCLLAASGCAVQRGQQSAGAYVDDAAITTTLKGRYVGNKEVDASSINVETLNGVVMLSGFAKNAKEKSTAESIAWKVAGVKSVKNELTIQP